MLKFTNHSFSPQNRTKSKTSPCLPDAEHSRACDPTGPFKGSFTWNGTKRIILTNPPPLQSFQECTNEQTSPKVAASLGSTEFYAFPDSVTSGGPLCDSRALIRFQMSLLKSKGGEKRKLPLGRTCNAAPLLHTADRVIRDKRWAWKHGKWCFPHKVSWLDQAHFQIKWFWPERKRDICMSLISSTGMKLYLSSLVSLVMFYC